MLPSLTSAPLGFSPGAASPNMNGDYILTRTPQAGDTKAKFPTHFADYPSLGLDAVESFDVYSPSVSSLYSQVFWKGLPPVDLPAHVVEKYRGRGMAIVGFELDQVRRTPQGDVSLPMTFAYNHHFESTLIGSRASFRKRGAAEAAAAAPNGHGHGRAAESYEVVEHEAGALPSSLALGAANGGEVRKSFHGYAPGFVQVVESPTQFQITPMQIDTWHREKMPLDDPKAPFVAGPLPRASLAPVDNPQSSSTVKVAYSGLLECPLTTRVHKAIDGGYTIARAGGVCAHAVLTPSECYGAARATLGTNLRYVHHAAPSPGGDLRLPAGCSAVADAANASVVHVTFNDVSSGSANTSAAPCGGGAGGGAASSLQLAGGGASLVDVQMAVDVKARSVTLTLRGPAGVWFGVGFNASAMKDAPWAIIVEPNNSNGNGAGIDGNGNGIDGNGIDGNGIDGNGNGNGIDGNDDAVAVSERRLADQGPGTLLPPTLELLSSSVVDGQRTIVLRRPLAAGSTGFAFPSTAGVLPFVNAVGSGAEFAYHRAKDLGTFSLLPVAGTSGGANASGVEGVGGACVCAAAARPFGAGQGTFSYAANTSQPADVGGGSVRFGNVCGAPNSLDLLEQRNPTCDARSYAGGQLTCHHMWSLLDADQEIPWADTPLVYSLKFRIWAQPYDAAVHTPVRRTTWGIASPVEYDVPRCGKGVAGCTRATKSSGGDGSGRGWVHTINGSFTGGGRLAAAHFHCHAPTCLSVAMYRCNMSEVDACNATTGELLCEERPVYGGTGQIDDRRFDEPGYIAQPPCLWGDAAYGLQPPPQTDGYTLHSVKTANATAGHHGEMAWQQMFLF